MQKEVADVYGHKVRVRVCGLCWEADKLLMVNHAGITNGDFWAPPGGGIEFGQSAHESLKREFREETGLVVEPADFLFGCEFIENPIHAIELFYATRVVSGTLKSGIDPEIQIIRDIRYMTIGELKKIPQGRVHGIFKRISSPAELMSLYGFFRI